MTDRPTVKVVPRAAADGMLVYARAGEAVHCAGGHVVGHFKSDAMVGSTPAGELEAVKGIYLGDIQCPWCYMPLTAGPGIYFFEAAEPHP